MLSLCLEPWSPSSHLTGISETYLGLPLGPKFTVNTPSSPTLYSSTRQLEVPWTGFSLTLAVSLMLFLAFGTSAPTSPEPQEPQDLQEPQAARGYTSFEASLLTGLRIAVLQVASLSRKERAEALTFAPASGK